MTRKELWTIAKATVREFGKDDVGYMAAAVTYYAFFSVFPLLLLAVSIASFFLDPKSASELIFNNVAQVAPGSVNLLNSAMQDAVKNRANAGWLALIGFGTLAFSASGAFDALDKAINRAWDTENTPNVVLGKLISFAMMATVAGLLLLSVIVSTILSYTQQFTSSLVHVPGSAFLWRTLNIAASFGIIFLGFVLVYRLVPRRDVRFRDVWLAALLGAAAWTGAKELFALYLGSSFANYAAIYGTLGAVIALLTWIYVSSIIILTGAEFASETARVREMKEKLKAGATGQPAEEKRSPWLPA